MLSPFSFGFDYDSYGHVFLDSASIDRSVLIIGERGTGKELAAERLHYLSLRWDQTFTKIKCSAIPHALCRALIETSAMGNSLNVDAGCPRRLTHR